MMPPPLLWFPYDALALVCVAAVGGAMWLRRYRRELERNSLHDRLDRLLSSKAADVQIIPREDRRRPGGDKWRPL
jgi:hypothetical protein